ncbi:hypothetical protein Fmac_021375 [Flemingia macrophylla]|uniref:Terpene synthase metal-binding domain-containing protein n=1 Tax=Flemingia macrophylla TaxID=520843 RepID=A0ABD1LX62_9FABA
MSGSVPVFAKDAKPPSEFRPIADYHPSVWGDHFISYLSPSHYKKFVRAYNTETRWLNDNYKPTIEEYLEISTISASYSLLTITSYIGMRYITTENIFKWVTNEPKIVKAANITSRLMDDIVSNEHGLGTTITS